MSASATADQPTAFKEVFDAARVLHVADEAAAVAPGFKRKLFLKTVLEGLDDLSLMQRLRRITEGLHAAIPGDFLEVVEVLRLLSPRINDSFVTLVLPDYVALYGDDPKHFDASMDALAFFTTFGSAEFAIRHFLARDLTRTLKVMERWSRDKNEHVRRLASEGSRPRLPWSFNIKPLMADPAPLATILDNLHADPSLYVRRSVANNLNDISKDNPAWALERIRGWDLDHKPTAWIAKHALRTLIKKGNREALAVIGAGEKAFVTVDKLRVTPNSVTLGSSIELALLLTSTADTSQRLVVDYAVHYVKQSGKASPKVFKLKTFDLAARESVRLGRKQLIADFTTRKHHPGRHEVDILVNGEVLGRTFFTLRTV